MCRRKPTPFCQKITCSRHYPLPNFAIEGAFEQTRCSGTTGNRCINQLHCRFWDFYRNPNSHLAALEQLSQRRFVKAMDLQAPGPTQQQVEQLLAAAARVPDHGKLGPGLLFSR